MDHLTSWVRIGLWAALMLSPLAYAVTPAEQLAAYTVQAGAAAQSQRGQQFFTSRHGKDWSCASCHTDTASAEGKHASTGKPIAPLAPAFNPDRFTDAAKTEKWFRRNCNDVLGRVCTPGEKADVLSWLLTLKR
ncbi:MAG: cytochrome C [Curvibacter sp. PD_MW3]|nr:MAG: cytochrome C [Curvibacter sp. PD_MW3]